ncbi:MAG: 3-deoxy-7-phosphoheptulonate synthase [Planctomycetes bacterium]|nr:3-deoxy-7-phosphoheptulonate synthase [Planctomycetota bacterium]
MSAPAVAEERKRKAGTPPLHSLERKPEPTVVDLGDGIAIGGTRVCVIAGPCAVESYEQTLEAARRVKAAGVRAMRGGAFKPRTSPYSFQGLGREGLGILARVKAETGLKIVTEAMDGDEIEAVAEVADMVQIGSRNMQNFSLLKKAGRVARPVLLKRGAAATLDEFLMAAEYVLDAGNPDVVLCERGIRTFDTHSRNTLDLNVLPVLRERTHLPVIIDPSHGTGRRGSVLPLSRASVAAGADGLLVEVHPDPDAALCDGDQSIRPEELAVLVDQCRAIARVLGRDL